MKKNRVINIVLNDPYKDSRVKKTTNSLRHLGYEVITVGLLKKRENKGELDPDIFQVDLSKNSFKLYKYLKFFFKVFYLAKDSDIIHCNDLIECTVGALVKLLKKDISIIYDSHEFQLERSFFTSKTEKYFISKIESLCLKFSDNVITVSDSIALEYKKRYGILPYVIYNYPSNISFSTTPPSINIRSMLNLNDDIVLFIHHGIFPKYSRGIELILEAFSKVSSKYCILFIGEGELKNEILSYSQKYENIFYHNFMELNDLMDSISQADYGIIFNRPGKLNHEYCLPNKLFDYLKSGKKVLSNDLTEIKKYLTKNNYGYVVKDYTVDSLIKSIIKLNGKEQIFLNDKEKFSWESQNILIRKIYEEI